MFITSDTEGASIYYTTNGSDPTEASKKLDDKEVLTLNQPVLLKAVAIKDGVSSEVSAVDYRNQPSDL